MNGNEISEAMLGKDGQLSSIGGEMFLRLRQKCGRLFKGKSFSWSIENALMKIMIAVLWSNLQKMPWEGFDETVIEEEEIIYYFKEL